MYLQRNQWIDYVKSTAFEHDILNSLATPYGFIGTTEIPGLLVFRKTIRDALRDWMRVDGAKAATMWLHILRGMQDDERIEHMRNSGTCYEMQRVRDGVYSEST